MNITRHHAVGFGFERFDAGLKIGRHIHASAYAAIVLDGGYEEAGSAGRRRVSAGDVVLHDSFDSHCDRFLRNGGRIFNLPLSRQYLNCKWARVRDPDMIVKTAHTDRAEAEARLLSELEPVPEPEADWPDELCSTLLAPGRISLTLWAYRHDLARETLSRQFGAIFGITPAAFRAEARARSALREIVCSDMPLSSIAAQGGFSDQAHMTRSVRSLTGRTPAAWRRSHSFKTGELRAA